MQIVLPTRGIFAAGATRWPKGRGAEISVADYAEAAYDDPWAVMTEWRLKGVNPRDAAQQTIADYDLKHPTTPEAPTQQFPVLEYPDQDELDYERRAEG
ncbi:MAG: hypothetical protein ACYTAN_17590 [Planctomycetota bacterium]